MKVRMMCVTLVAALTGVAQAGERDFVIEHAGVGGTSEQAAPYIQKFLEYVPELFELAGVHISPYTEATMAPNQLARYYLASV